MLRRHGMGLDQRQRILQFGPSIREQCRKVGGTNLVAVTAWGRNDNVPGRRLGRALRSRRRHQPDERWMHVGLSIPLSTMLQILSVTLFEKLLLQQAFIDTDSLLPPPEIANQLNLFDS